MLLQCAALQPGERRKLIMEPAGGTQMTVTEAILVSISVTSGSHNGFRTGVQTGVPENKVELVKEKSRVRS
jgi:hypothetical protein